MTAALGAVAGGLGAGGVLLVWWGADALRVRLDDRLAPYLRVPSRGSTLLADSRHRTPFPTVEQLLAPVLADAVALVARIGPSTAQLRGRLARAGRADTAEQFRVGQVVSAAVGGAAGLAIAVALAAAGAARPVGLLALVGVAALLGALVPDRLLSRQVAARERRVVAELPTVAELVALAVTAGEGVVAALDRVARQTSGVMSEELAATLADVHAGVPVTVALERLADRTGVAGLGRLAEAVVVAVERGTPLGDVLRAQAQDVREQARRALLDQAGRKEVAMMVPVVFLVLPVTVVFALFPSLVALQVAP